MVGAIIVVIVLIRFAGPHRTNPAADGQPISTTIATDLATVPAGYFNQMGVTGASIPYGGTATEWKSGGKPVMLYVGAEYCPYCAASRWAMVTALSRFGSFTGLRYMSSSISDPAYPGTPTVTFVDAKYTSPYLIFQTVEQQTNVLDSSIGTYPTLQKTTKAQAAVLSKYQAVPYLPSQLVGGIPFIDVANRYLWSATLYSPQVLTGLSWSAIASDIHTASGPPAQPILANANMISAAICSVDGARPAAVCQSPAVVLASKKLPAPQHGKSPVGGGTA